MSDVSNHALYIVMIVRTTTTVQVDQCACWVVVVLSGR
jgi:hypothetical protein